MPFNGAINFSKMFLGMARCRAKLHCYFIDSCSNVPVSTLRIENAGARFFLSADPLRPRTPGLVLKAAVAGQSAYATSGQASRFTEALVHCLRELGCTNEGGQWVVRTSTLFDRLTQAVKWLYAKKQHEPQGQREPLHLPGNGPDMPDGIIQVRNRPPLVPVNICLDPSVAIKGAAFDLRAMTDATWRPQPGWPPAQDSGTEVWELDPVPAGVYSLNARFPAGTYWLEPQFLFVVPPGPWPQPNPRIQVRKEGV
jgi:hypothetical protein